MSINELRSITTFVKAAELGSLSKAAESQHISPQAASKALTQLEKHLGVRLFHRTTRQLALTEEGRQLLSSVQPPLQQLQQSLLLVQQSKEQFGGPLRISAPRSVVQQVIGSVLDEYCRLYPEVQPDVQLDDRITNWVQERIDVGFRLGHSPQDGLIARRLFPLQLVICASPAYLRRFGVPTSLAQLSAHRLSLFRSPVDGSAYAWMVTVDGAVQEYQVTTPALTCNDEAFELRSVLAGNLIAQLAAPTAAPYLRSGQLVPLLLEHTTDYHYLYIYYGSRQAQPTRVRRFLDLAIERLHDSREFVVSSAELAEMQAQGFAKALTKG